MSIASRQFLVTMLSAPDPQGRRESRTRVWDSASPLAIGHPFRWVIERTKNGFRLRDISARVGLLQKSSSQEITEKDIKRDALIDLPGSEAQVQIRPMLKLDPRAAVDAPAIKMISLSIPETTADERRWFNRSMQSSGGAIALLLLISFFVTKTEVPEETKDIIPPQYAKLVMTKPKSAPQPAGSAQAGGGQTAKAKDTALVQTMRTKALQSAVKGLLKGGMTRALAQSNLLAGTTSANTLLNAGTQHTGPLGDKVGNSKVTLAAVGGSGMGGSGTGTGIGYGKGEHAGVQGQGQGFVDLDTFGSSVEEGLTKDEVGRVIHAHMSEIRYCYESAMIRTPQLDGKLMVDFVIGSNGMVRTTAVKQSTLPDPKLDDCILRRLAKWPFPLPKGGVEVSVSYPFIFKNLGI